VNEAVTFLALAFGLAGGGGFTLLMGPPNAGARAAAIVALITGLSGLVGVLVGSNL
jgi:hypothetical protein